jgi:hypothetical protein
MRKSKMPTLLKYKPAKGLADLVCEKQNVVKSTLTKPSCSLVLSAVSPK